MVKQYGSVANNNAEAQKQLVVVVVVFVPHPLCCLFRMVVESNEYMPKYCQNARSCPKCEDSNNNKNTSKIVGYSVCVLSHHSLESFGARATIGKRHAQNLPFR